MIYLRLLLTMVHKLEMDEMRVVRNRDGDDSIMSQVQEVTT